MSSIADSPDLPIAPAQRARGLWSAEGLEATERLMRQLSVGTRLDRLGTILQEHLDTGGKRLRARLALGAAESLGVQRSRAVPWAAACELLHNATLLHDDVQDGDRLRRGREAAWVRHGVGHAITAGDLALMLPWRSLEQLDTTDDVRWQLGSALAQQACRVARGQADEGDLLPRRRMGWNDYEHVVMGKTSALFVLPVLGAARLAGLDREAATTLARQLEHLGLLYQIQDDVLDLYGDKGRDTIGSDIGEGKVSALVVEHLARRPADGDWLLSILERPRSETTQDDVDAVIRRFRDEGTLHAVWQRMYDIEDRIVYNEALERWPRLHALAVELVALAVAPIAHTAPLDTLPVRSA